MGDKQKHSVPAATNDINKIKNSKKDIRAKIGLYLKNKNYTSSEIFNKSTCVLTQTEKQLEFNLLLQEDTSKVNSFLYSNPNVLSLNNDLGIVEQQFSKFLQFVPTQKNIQIKKELQQIIRPLYCHLYIDLLKGKDPRLAIDFLKKFAYVIAPIDNLNSPLPRKINGTSINSIPSPTSPSTSTSTSPTLTVSSSSITSNNITSFPSSKTKITFQQITDTSSSSTSETNGQEYFKKLVEIMSTCLRIEEFDQFEITKDFRYSKYDIELSLQTIYILKTYLAKNGHVIIIHILQTWFSFDITDVIDSDDELYINNNNDNFMDDINKNIKKNGDKVVTDDDRKNKTKRKLSVFKEFNKVISKISDLITITPLRKIVSKMSGDEFPIKIFDVGNDNFRLCAADVDPLECHLACGFDNSTIKLWSLKHKKYYGIKPYEDINSRLCEWNLNSSTNIEIDDEDDENDNEDDEYDNEDDGEYDDKDENLNECFNNDNDNDESMQNNYKSTKGSHKKHFVYNDLSEYTLRGHSKGVTDLFFSKQNPILVSVSKDLTMRLWKASNYQCAAVYRGHNYPIWCVAESSNGSYLATGSRDRTARLWSTDRLYPLQTYIGHTQDVDTIAFHPNGGYLASGSNDLTVRLWCVTSGKLFRVFTECKLPIHCLCFSPDGKLLAAAGEETKIRIFDLSAGSQLNELPGHTSPIISLAWHQNGTKIVSSCSDGTIRIFNVEHIEKLTLPPTPKNSIFTQTLPRATSKVNHSSNKSKNSNSTAAQSNSNDNYSNNKRLLVEHKIYNKRPTKILFNINELSISCISSR